MKKFNRIVDDYHDNEKPVRSYKVGRNDSCPCGSEKKYKKCCDRVKPEKPREYYYEKIEEEEDLEELFEILQKAVEDYPLDHSLILPLVVYLLQRGEGEKSLDYLHRAWRLMGTDLEDDFVLALVNLLLEKEDFYTAREIVNKCIAEKEESSTLLLARGEVLRASGQFEEALEMVKKARKLNPNDSRAIGFKMELFLDMNNVPGAIDVFLNNFDLLKNYRALFVTNYLKSLLKERFALSSDANDEELKEKLRLARDVFEKWEDMDRFMASYNRQMVEKKLSEIENLLPAEAEISVNLLNYHLDLRNYHNIINLAEKLQEYHSENIDFNRILFEANFNTDRIEKAGTYIKKAFNLSSKEEKRKRSDIIFGYIKYLIENETQETLMNYLKEVDSLIGERRLLSLIHESWLSGKDDDYIIKLLDILLENEISGLSISEREVFVFYIFTTLVIVERKKSRAEGWNKAREKLEMLIERGKEEAIKSPLLKYGDLFLREEEMSEEEVESRVEEILNIPSKIPEEGSIKYETLIKYGNPQKILSDPPDVEMFEKEDEYKFYAFVAAVVLEKEDQIKKYLPSVINWSENILSLLLQLPRYMEIEKIQNLLEIAGMEDKMIDNYIQMIKNQQKR